MEMNQNNTTYTNTPGTATSPTATRLPGASHRFKSNVRAIWTIPYGAKSRPSSGPAATWRMPLRVARSTRRRSHSQRLVVVAQALVVALSVIMTTELAKRSFERATTEQDDAVETLLFDGPNEALSMKIAIRDTWRNQVDVGPVLL